MKILFWVFAIVSVLIGAFVSMIGYFANGLELAGTAIGDVVYVAGMFSTAVSIVCVVLGIIKLRKGNVKKAVAFALVGVIYSVVMLAGMYIDEAVHTKLMEKDIANRKEEMYGENWDSAPAIEEIPELYAEVLNEVYAMAKDQLDGCSTPWPT